MICFTVLATLQEFFSIQHFEEKLFLFVSRTCFGISSLNYSMITFCLVLIGTIFERYFQMNTKQNAFSDSHDNRKERKTFKHIKDHFLGR